jgi:hypothetical protein
MRFLLKGCGLEDGGLRVGCDDAGVEDDGFGAMSLATFGGVFALAFWFYIVSF